MLRRKQAYGWVLGNAGLFLVLSATNDFVGITTIAIHAITAFLFFIGSIVGVVLLVRSGGVLAAITFFILGTGFFFGFGTTYSTIAELPRYFNFTTDVQTRTLPEINLINALATFVALLVAGPFCWSEPSRKIRPIKLRYTIAYIQPLRTPLMLISIPITLLTIVNFPVASNLIVRNLLGQTGILVDLAILLYAAAWTKLNVADKAIVTVLTAVQFVIGLLALSKSQMILPLAVFGIGLLFDLKSQKTLIGYATVVVAGYFLIFAPICSFGRTYPTYRPDDNTIIERLAIVEETWINDVGQGDRSIGDFTVLQRFIAAPIQATLISRYDEGTPGTSIVDGWIAVIPRVLWPDKPIVTQNGTDLDNWFFNRFTGESALAPTFSAEAYWNGGWLAVVLIAILIGLEIGWLTRKWQRLLEGGSEHIGVLIFSALIFRLFTWTEAWVAPSYFGGFATVIVLVKLGDWVAPMVLDIGRNAHRTAFVTRNPKIQWNRRLL
jgi:hypothetical protein